MKTKIIIIALLLFIPLSNGYTAISMGARLAGKIVLDVESGRGEAWWIFPDTNERYYLKDGATAYSLMRTLGLGISEIDLAKIPIAEDSELPFVKEENEEVISYVTDKYGEQVQLIDGFSFSGKTAQEITDERIQYLLGSMNETEVIEEYVEENISNYFETIVAITCVDYYGDILAYGSGSLITNSDKNWVLTNNHVVEGASSCWLYKDDVTFIELELEIYSWNVYGDVALLEVMEQNSNLDYSLDYMSKCDAKEPIGSKVYALGFPSYSFDSKGYAHLILTEGVISGYREADTRLPYDNYLVDLKLESGGSGGLAFVRKDDGSLCKLGITTAVRTGNYENLGVIQNLHNIHWTD